MVLELTALPISSGRAELRRQTNRVRRRSVAKEGKNMGKVKFAGVLALTLSLTASHALAQDTIRIALFGFAADNAFTLSGLEGLKDAAAEAGNVEVEMFDGAFDASKQITQVQDAIASGRFDGMLIYPMGYSSIVPAAEEAIAAGIKFGSLEYPAGTRRHDYQPIPGRGSNDFCWL